MKIVKEIAEKLSSVYSNFEAHALLYAAALEAAGQTWAQLPPVVQSDFPHEIASVFQWCALTAAVSAAVVRAARRAARIQK